MNGWTAYRDGRERVMRWMHHGYGLEVRHCGHPTALYPYYIEGRIDLGTFAKLEAAQLRALLI